MINYLFKIAQHDYPYYEVLEIDVISVKKNIVEYKVRVSSKLDKHYQYWMKSKKIDIKDRKFIRDLRNDKLKQILD